MDVARPIGLRPRGHHETAPSWRDVLACYIAAGHGLAAVHAAGLEHGDFKPDNVLVGKDGRARVVDFGIARRMTTASPAPDDVLDVQGMGTRAYMAPERMIDQPSDARADVFSFCVSIWESIYGTRPYAGDNIYELLESMKLRRLEFCEPLRGTPSGLRKILAAGVSPRTADRPATMDVLLRALGDGAASPVRGTWSWSMTRVHHPAVITRTRGPLRHGDRVDAICVYGWAETRHHETLPTDICSDRLLSPARDWMSRRHDDG